MFYAKDLRNLARVLVVFSLIPTISFEQAYASTAGPGHVNWAVVHSTSVAFFSLDVATPAYPPCAIAQRYVVNLATTGGQAAWSAILTALKSHSQISVTGRGTCDSWAEGETVDWIEVFP